MVGDTLLFIFNRMILGLDLSTTVCGYCGLDENGDIELFDHYTFKSKEMLEKAAELKEMLSFIFAAHNVTEFYIEERLQGFRAGGTNADAIFKTAAINFYCQVLIKERGIPITALNVNAARSSAIPGFHKIARTMKGTKHKEIIFNMVVKKLGEKYFDTKVMKNGKRKGEVVYLEEGKDRADAWVIATAGKNLSKK